MTSPTSLSAKQARKLILLSQGIHKENALGRGPNATLNAIEKLGYIQIDTISVVERAHHHTLWARSPSYQKEHLDQLLEQKRVFEYWSHAAAYLPMRDFRFSLPYKEAISSGSKHWHQVEDKLKKQVLQRVADEGPLQARDFEHPRKHGDGWWEWKPAKRALEQLFIEGKLMIARRQGFQKIYDLAERVLPEWVDTRMPSEEEHLDHLIINYLRANGLGAPAHIAYLRKGFKPALTQRCQQLCEQGELIEVCVGAQPYFALSTFESQLSNSISRRKVKILSPFDNVLIQRKRTLDLFGFDYLIECYVPEKKRKFGYFCLPLLWGQEFVGMMDAKIDRKTGVLHIRKLHIQSSLDLEAFLEFLKPSLMAFLAFNGGKQLLLEKVFIHRKAVNKSELRRCQTWLNEPSL